MNTPLEFAYEAAKSSTDDCIIWPFYVAPHGYGRIKLPGEKTPRGAHRFVCELVYGPQPFEGANAAHNCRNRACVNPRHLRWATSSENHQDKIPDGTIIRGRKHKLNKLTEDQVREIRALDGIVPKRHLAARFGVTPTLIRRIINGQVWGWLDAGRRFEGKPPAPLYPV